MEIRCEGACEIRNGGHVGNIYPVYVLGWGRFNYCERAIQEDRANGFDVEIIDEDLICQ